MVVLLGFSLVTFFLLDRSTRNFSMLYLDTLHTWNTILALKGIGYAVIWNFLFLECHRYAVPLCRFHQKSWSFYNILMFSEACSFCFCKESRSPWPSLLLFLGGLVVNSCKKPWKVSSGTQVEGSVGSRFRHHIVKFCQIWSSRKKVMTKEFWPKTFERCCKWVVEKW